MSMYEKDNRSESLRSRKIAVASITAGAIAGIGALAGASGNVNNVKTDTVPCDQQSDPKCVPESSVPYTKPPVETTSSAPESTTSSAPESTTSSAPESTTSITTPESTTTTAVIAPPNMPPMTIIIKKPEQPATPAAPPAKAVPHTS